MRRRGLTAKNPELKKYTRKEIDAMVFYKSDAGYSAINNNLRRGDVLDDNLKQRVDFLERAILKNKFNYDETIYRGFSLDRELKVGDSLDDTSFMSISRDVEVSREFSTAGFGNYYYLLEISKTKNSLMLEIDELEDAMGETPIKSEKYY